MSVTDAQRRRLHAELERLLGPESAETMMDLLPPLGWSDVARQPLVDAQFIAVRGEMAELRAEVSGQAKRLLAYNAVAVVAASMSTAGLVLAAARFG
jgi:hypothetical protein